MRLIALCSCLLTVACAPGDGPQSSRGAAGPPSVSTPGAEEGTSRRPSTDNPGAPSESAFETTQTLYVPVYSHVYWGSDQKHFSLACTLSVRNVDRRSSISLTAVDYHNTSGALVKRFVEQPRVLGPLETVDFYIPERDTSGGSGANFIVEWGSSAGVNAPVVEAVMIGVHGGQGMSFVSPAREVAEWDARDHQ